MLPGSRVDHFPLLICAKCKRPQERSGGAAAPRACGIAMGFVDGILRMRRGAPPVDCVPGTPPVDCTRRATLDCASDAPRAMPSLGV
jgi:hypothetical protein